MLRALVLGLLLANAGYFAWTQGWLMALGLAPVQQAEPQRLTQQINPEAMRLIDSTAAAAVVDPVAAPAQTASEPVGECLQAGVFSDAEANALRPRLQGSLPEGSWAFSPVVVPGRWILYMGRYANEEMVAKKRSELRARGVAHEPVQNPSLNPGLSLGHFDNKADADRELAKDVERGVRTARVIQERPEARGQRLTLPVADAALKAQLAALKPRLAGKLLVSCV
jgi:hypothetical protein